MRHFTVLLLAVLITLLSAQYTADEYEEEKRGGGRAFQKRGGARAFLTESKRGGARAFQAYQDKRGGARAFLMNKRAGGRAFLEAMKRDEDWVIQPYGDDRLEKRGGGRSFPVKTGQRDD